MQVPFKKDGSICHTDHWENDFIWKDIESFYAVLKFDHIYCPNSSPVFFWKDVITGGLYPMCRAHFVDCMQGANFQDVRGAIIDGKFGVQKKGMYYSIFPIFEEDLPEKGGVE